MNGGLSLDPRPRAIAIRGSILPLVFGVLITLYLDLAFATAYEAEGADLDRRPAADDRNRCAVQRRRRHLPDRQRRAAGDAAAVGQRSCSRQFWQAWRRSRTPEGIIALDDVSRLANCGNKAYRLARMRAAGMPVPDGIVLTPAFMARMAAAPASTRAPRARLDLAAPRQRPARSPQLGRGRGWRQPQLRRRVRIGDRRRSRRTRSGDRPRPGLVRSRAGVELRLLRPAPATS